MLANVRKLMLHNKVTSALNQGAQCYLLLGEPTTFVSQAPNARQNRSIYKLCRVKQLFEEKKKSK